MIEPAKSHPYAAQPALARCQSSMRHEDWLRGLDLNQRPSGYEPDELPDCSTPRHHTTDTKWQSHRRCDFGNASLSRQRTRENVRWPCLYQIRRECEPLIVHLGEKSRAAAAFPIRPTPALSVRDLLSLPRLLQPSPQYALEACCEHFASSATVGCAPPGHIGACPPREQGHLLVHALSGSRIRCAHRRSASASN